MNLFGFMKDIGQKLFDRDEDAAASIKKHIEADNPGVENLQVKFNEGTVELAGDTADRAALEKAVLMAGNVRGVAEVKAATPQSAADDGEVEFYVIKSGDTLSGIAKRYYGNAMDYPRIFEANREVIKDPDKIYVGQTIRIPLK